jgi:hypothetical protein
MSNVRRRDLVKEGRSAVLGTVSVSLNRAMVMFQRICSEGTHLHVSSIKFGRIGFCSSTLLLVKPMHATALARTGLCASLPVALVSTGGEPKQMNATVRPFRSVLVGSVESRVAAAQATTPNPSIEGMPKRLRLLVTPHVKR